MKHSLSLKLILLIALLAISFPSFSQAAIGDVTGSIGKFTGCTAGGIAGQAAGSYISDKIGAGLKSLTSKIPGLGSLTGGIDAVPVEDKKLVSKETGADIAARCLAREILSAITDRAGDIARTQGRDGGATWVQDWRSLNTESQTRGEGIFRAMLSTTKLCSYMSGDIKTLFGANSRVSLGKLNVRVGDFDPFTTKAACTLPKSFNMANYQKDFVNNGGWAAFAKLVEPQNNQYGLLSKSLDEVDKQRAAESSADEAEAIAGRGFLGTRSCVVKSNGKCIVYSKIKTPGSVIGGLVEDSNKAEIDWIVSADEISEVIASGIEILFNRMIDLSNPNDGDYLIPGDVDYALPTETQDPEAGACYSNSAQKQSISLIIAEADTSVKSLNTADFQGTFVLGTVNKLRVSAALNSAYVRLYEIEKTLTDSKRQEFRSVLQGWGVIIRGASESIKSMTWETSAQRVDVERQLNEIKSAISSINSQSGSLPICGEAFTPPPGFPNLLEDLRTERARYGTTMTKEQIGKLLNAVAWKNRSGGWGLSRKTGGENCNSPVGLIACDILYHQPTNIIVDALFAAGEGQVSTPMWEPLGVNADTSRPWVGPVDPGGSTGSGGGNEGGGNGNGSGGGEEQSN